MMQLDESLKCEEYQTNFICTYHLVSDQDDSEALYQVQFLQAFNLETFVDKPINDITIALYKKFESNKIITKLMSFQNKFDDKELKFRLCFSYDTFYILHRILCSLIKNETLLENEINNLFNKIEI
jgi:hypothetical protein